MFNLVGGLAAFGILYLLIPWQLLRAAATDAMTVATLGTLLDAYFGDVVADIPLLVFLLAVIAVTRGTEILVSLLDGGD